MVDCNHNDIIETCNSIICRKCGLVLEEDVYFDNKKDNYEEYTQTSISSSMLKGTCMDYRENTQGISQHQIDSYKRAFVYNEDPLFKYFTLIKQICSYINPDSSKLFWNAQFHFLRILNTNKSSLVIINAKTILCFFATYYALTELSGYLPLNYLYDLLNEFKIRYNRGKILEILQLKDCQIIIDFEDILKKSLFSMRQNKEFMNILYKKKIETEPFFNTLYKSTLEQLERKTNFPPSLYPTSYMTFLIYSLSNKIVVDQLHKKKISYRYFYSIFSIPYSTIFVTSKKIHL
jgi:hypothetical protein